MPHQAIVHAPRLRPGARLCLSDLEQREGEAVATLKAGETIRMRFGVCCPDLATGAVDSADESQMVLDCRGEKWALHRAQPGGVTIPGLRSQTWFVTERFAMG